MELKVLSSDEKAKFSCDIIEMLEESDKDFVPPLSARSSPLQKDLNHREKGAEGVLAYYEGMKEQEMLGALEDGELVAFVSYRHNYANDVIKDELLPNIYISTLVMKRKARGNGLTAAMYDHIFNTVYPQKNILTRTWSTNAAHTRILQKFDFHELCRIENDRGEGIDTVYYLREKA